jgi:hypothetical protein
VLRAVGLPETREITARIPALLRECTNDPNYCCRAGVRWAAIYRVSTAMAILFAVLLAFTAGFVVRSFLGRNDASDFSEIERHYEASRFHSYE